MHTPAGDIRHEAPGPPAQAAPHDVVGKDAGLSPWGGAAFFVARAVPPGLATQPPVCRSVFSPTLLCWTGTGGDPLRDSRTFWQRTKRSLKPRVTDGRGRLCLRALGLRLTRSCPLALSPRTACLCSQVHVHGPPCSLSFAASPAPQHGMPEQMHTRC